jgi:hypothetical protein
MKSLPKRPSNPEEVYAEWDDEYSTWAIFGLSSGFCYSQPWNEEEAKKQVADMNRRFQKA